MAKGKSFVEDGIHYYRESNGTLHRMVEYDKSKTMDALIDEYQRHGTVGGRPVDDDLEESEKPSSATPGAAPATPIPVNPKPVKGDIDKGTNNPEGVAKGIGFKPIMNPMSEILQPSYHFSFYLDGELPADRGKGNEFVIAETGLTGMNIQEVNIDAIVGPNQRTKNAMSTNVTIRIYEPYGALLPDLLFQAAVTMGIRNYLKAPWFLKLRLHGYDEEGKVVKVGDSWTWMLSLIDVQSQISENGAMHTITAMPLSEQAFNDQYCMLAQANRSNGTTVGEALQKVIDGMNDSVKDRYGRGGQPLIEFAVKDRPYTMDTKVGVSRPFELPITNSNPTTGKQTNNEDYDVQTGHFGPGTDFPAIVDKVLARSEQANKMMRNSRELPPSSGNDDEKEIKDVTSIAHRVDTQVEYLDYDYVAGDYRKRITYIIKPYISLRLMTSMGRAKKFDKDPKLSTEKARYAVQQAFMRKQYDYIFTGLNTEIEKFDINVNFNWAVQVPTFQAQQNNTGTPSQIDLGKNADTLQADLNTQNGQLEAAETARKEFDQTHPNDPNNPLSEEDTAARQKLEDDYNNLKKKRDDTSTLLGRKRDEFNAEMNRARNEQLARRPIPTTRTIDGEDMVYENAQGSQDFHGAAQNSASYLPITIVQDASNPGIRTSTGTSNDNDPKKTVYGALLNQLYGTMDGNLQSIELDIRGDPYWLGPGDNGLPFDSPSTDSTPNWANGEHIFLFRFKLPLGYNSKTGTVATTTGQQAGTPGAKPSMGDQATIEKLGTDSNIFTGFYACIEVNNKFQEGKFTQTLKGTRIAGWLYENIIEGRESAVADDTVFNNAPGPKSPEISKGNRPSGTNPGVRGNNLDERTLLAVTLMGEAGGEGDRGMQAVGNVIMNRARYGYRGNTPSQVIMSPSQFSVWNDQDPAAYYRANKDKPTYARAYDMAGKLLDGSARDITDNATSYLNVAETRRQRGGSLPSWYKPSKVTAVIGNHTFLKGV